MSRQKVHVPDIGDFESVDVVEVLVSAGDEVAAEDPLISLESDKATLDVPSPAAGKVVEVKVKAGDKVAEGDLILVMETAAEEAEPASGAEPEEEEREPSGEEAPAQEPTAEEGPGEEPPAPAESAGATAPAQGEADLGPAPVDEYEQPAHIYASPAVRRFARELGVDLSRVKGTGRKGRILREDVQGHVKKAMELPAGGGGGGLELPEMPRIDFSRFGEVERQPLSRIQRISGPNLHRSWLHVPLVTQHDEADITELEAFRQAHKSQAAERGFSLTPLAFVMRAAVAALEEFPQVNASLDPDGEGLILKRYYHLGIAVDTDGGLVVPVIRDVDKKGIFELAGELADVSGRAREGKLKPEELRGASFTISSLGGIGGTFFTPLVNAPEVAILGVSRHRMSPVWQDGEFVPRLLLPLSLSYDHRVVDGAMAVRFTRRLAELLADIRRLLL
ncbi:MAG: dihydrolipoyllysine-residue acetyltransferase [Thermoanaerobaculia bacterium]|nr:dihydrolipoyllysine-residue acetyltransferase [Thermoanaerobaculia bacterium]